MLKCIFPLFVTLSTLLICCTISHHQCGEEHFYYDEKDIESLRCALEHLEKSYNYTNVSVGVQDGRTTPPPVEILTITRDKVLNPMYEDSFPEVFCKKCSIQLGPNRLATTIKCFQCIDAETKSITLSTEYKKVFIY